MQTWRRLATTGCAILLLVVGVGACGDRGASQRTTGPYAVGTRSLTFVDKTRETPAFGETPTLPTRTARRPSSQRRRNACALFATRVVDGHATGTIPWSFVPPSSNSLRSSLTGITQTIAFS